MKEDKEIFSEIMGIKDACKYLKISKGLLRKLPIEKIHVRRRVLYKKSSILTYLNDNTMRTKND